MWEIRKICPFMLPCPPAMVMPRRPSPSTMRSPPTPAGVLTAVQPGAGSCIFLHIWERPFKGTSGCTAVSALDLEGLLRRLGPQDQPLLIQLPRQAYERLALPWGLP